MASATTQHVLPPITSSWHEAWVIFKTRFWTFVALAVLPQLLSTGAVYLLSTIILSDIRASGTVAHVFSLTNPILYVVIMAAILLFFFQVLASAAIIWAASKRGHVGILQAFDEARHFVWRIFLTGVLTVLIASVAAIIGYLLTGAFTALVVAVNVQNPFEWFSWLSLIPYVFFLLVAARYSFAGIAVVMEQTGTLQALKRSAQLMKGQYWHIIFRLFLVYAIIFLVIFGAGFIPYVGGLLAAALCIPFGVVYTFVLYEELIAARP